MAPELSQEQVLQQTQTQTQSILPLQYSLMRLLELPVSDLESRVKNEMLENSALEEVQKEENARNRCVAKRGRKFCSRDRERAEACTDCWAEQ